MEGAEAYIDSAKDTWRGWKWNTISDAAVQWARISPAEKSRRLASKTVLYLVGPDDHDRRKALAKGFANHNLIAVDLVEERVQEVRRQGGLAIRGSLHQILLNWPHDWPIDVVDADFCGGLTNDAMRLARCLAYSPLQLRCVVSINLLRGRDEQSNDLRKLMKQRCADVRHRGESWAFCVAGVICASTGRETITKEVIGSLRSKFSSYRSKTSGQWFDSAAILWPLVPRNCHTEECEYCKSWAQENLSRVARNEKGIRGRIAALRAVRTAKLRKA